VIGLPLLRLIWLTPYLAVGAAPVAVLTPSATYYAPLLAGLAPGGRSCGARPAATISHRKPPAEAGHRIGARRDAVKAVVMAGGEGSRLRPLTIGRPKPMVPIVNVPVLEHILRLLKRHGATEVVVTLQYLANVIQDYFGDGSDFGLLIRYAVEETPLGTAGSVRNAAEWLRDEPFLVISGDALTDFDLSAILASHRQKGALATLTLYRVPNPLEYGVVISAADGRVVRFLEKPSWGEVFSDTVNTGIYVFDPRIFDHVPPDRPVDWSQEVFPQLLRNEEPLFGYVAAGYWCDVGNLAEYMRANADLLNGLVRLELEGTEQPGRIWTAGEVSIHPTARLYGPLYLGKGVQIRAGAILHGPTAIGDYTVLEAGATVNRSVIWPNCYVGERADLRGALVGRSCSLKAMVVVFEGAVIGDGCSIGEGAIIRPNVKLWPNKEIEEGATVSASIIWGQQGRRAIFGRSGVSGLANVEFVPEFAYGSVLPKGARVCMNRDLSRAARMIKRAMIGGLVSAGVNVLDTASAPVPVVRYEIRQQGADGGVHVRMSPYSGRVVDVKVFDGQGLNIDRNMERKTETIFFREDFRRVAPEEIGSIQIVAGRDGPDPVRARYTAGFLAQVKREPIRRAGLRAVVDYAFGPTAEILPPVLAELGAESIAINAATGGVFMARQPEEYERDLRQLAQITATIGASVGAMMDLDGKSVGLIDDRGAILPHMTALAAFAILAWRSQGGGTVVVPATAPRMLEHLAAQYGGKVLRTRATPEAAMAAAARAEPEQPILCGDGLGAYVFPSFHPGFDGMMALARLLQYLAEQGTRLSEVVASLPPYHLGQAQVPCPWEAKGRVMRALHERARQRGRDGLPEPEEGVRFDLAEREWALVIPDADRPLFHIFTESVSAQQAAALAEQYGELVRSLER